MMSNDGEASSSSSAGSPYLVPFSKIQLGTQDFAENMLLGKGGFGNVYKGKLTIEGKDLLVAVKRLKSASQQGEAEFNVEVDMLSRLSHENVISLIGYCKKGNEMIIMYELMSNGTLEEALCKGPTTLTWLQRLKIILGVAKGLEYVHGETSSNEAVIHRDVKSSNVLLDENWEAKISDFGLSKIFQTDHSSTHVTTLVKYTEGYCDPRYMRTGHISRETDIYAFGVIVLQILCGRKAVDYDVHVDQRRLEVWAKNSIKKGRLKQIVDSNLKDTPSSQCLKMLADLAVRCLNDDIKSRPTMAGAVKEVESILALQEKKMKRKSSIAFASIISSATSSKPLELNHLSVGGQDQIFRRFDYNTIRIDYDTILRFPPEAKDLSENHFDMYKGNLKTGRDVVVCGPFNEGHREEYMNEASRLADLKHANLVKLLGYSVNRRDMYLLYDVKRYQTLKHLVFGVDHVQFDWDERYKILLGVALALVYLHNHAPERVIHFAVNPGHIMLDMLDGSLIPKLFGFYFAQTQALDDETETGDGRTEMVPDYTKSDVRDFGVLLLETLTGVSRSQPEELLEKYVETKLREGKLLDGIDCRIGDLSLLKFVIMVGLRCTRVDLSKRPTMQEVVDLLFCASLGLVRSINTLDCDVRVRTLVMGPFIGSNSMPLRLYLPIIGGEDQIFWRFDVSAVVFSHEANKFSQTQFGTCKGYLGNGRPVVVCGPFTEYNLNEYMNEASILANLKHENLVQLAGYDVKGGLMYLFYDCNPYATLDHLLFGGIDHVQLDWDARYKILLGVAEVLVYLHNHAPVQVTHSAVKPDHIMLDMSLNLKLFGFYSAKTRALDEIETADGRTKCTESDVHDFGVLLLKTLTGIRRTQSGELLENFVERSWREGKLRDIIDRRISVELSFLERVIMIGLMCTRVDRPDKMFNRMAHRVEPRVRPTMKEVVGLLRGTLSGDFKQSIDKLNWEMGVMKKKMGG